ncbi:MarR family transcriptional regulator [Plantibacter sp. CFBP 8775]|uniref:MarR family transcriptional regulator n=1 Tax=Plantibacter sp. CFBP 8775 TaxID=2774038 RepID=UPI001783C13D|nr:helix-turn-helix domain-containing protein [Plantibacter sp. CFBP 8775]MBD8104796.1 MarR family transcriptional regulator [Plantibacter sp. CFBP 8775]
MAKHMRFSRLLIGTAMPDSSNQTSSAVFSLTGTVVLSALSRHPASDVATIARQTGLGSQAVSATFTRLASERVLTVDDSGRASVDDRRLRNVVDTIADFIGC